MIKKWLSSYNFNYPRSIAYMLQASEYKIPAYLKWLWHIKSFRKVEVRKHFVKTAKSICILAVAWIIAIGTYVLAYFVLTSSLSAKYFLFLLIIALAPFVLAYGIIIPLVIIKFLIQTPIERYIIKKAKEKLKNHKGMKIGIAGSFGKTTMREILKTVLGEGKKVAAPPHSYNTLLGISKFVKGLKGDEEILIFEFGEYYKGDIREMCELVNPEIGVITGINEAHLEKFKNLETTAGTIFELADWLGEKPLYVNGENKIAKEKASSSHMVYTREGVSSWRVENPQTGLDGTSFELSYRDEKFESKSNLLGLHQIGPLVTAIDIAFKLRIPMEDIKKGVEKTKPFDHRLEPKIDSAGVTILDDSYNGNPDGVKAVIAFLVSIRGHRRIYMTPGLVEMGDRMEAVHIEIGKSLAQAGIEKVILIRNSVAPYIEKGLKEFNYKGDIIWFEDGLSALGALPHLTVNGDVVLLQNDWPDQYY